jgi:hypothetical protein
VCGSRHRRRLGNGGADERDLVGGVGERGCADGWVEWRTGPRCQSQGLRVGLGTLNINSDFLFHFP